MIEFIKDYWHFFVAGIILVALIAYWVFELVRSKRAKERELDQMEAELEKLEKEEEPAPEVKQPKTKKVVAEKAEDKKEETAGDYIVSYDSEKKDWVIKKEGSKRATKRTATKQEALDFVKKLTEGQEVNVVVKKKDGKVEK